MTHAIISPAGDFLLYADVFGVTRLALGKAVKVKHTVKVSEAHGDLSVHAAGTLALVHGRVHTGAYGNRGTVTLGLPALGIRDKLSASYDPHALTTTAAGDRVVALRSDESLAVQALDGAALREERSIALPAKAARALDARSVGPQAEGHGECSLLVAPDGRFIARGYRGVYAGRVGADDASDEVWWAMPLAAHPSAEVTLALVGETGWVFVRDAAAEVVRALVVARDGVVRTVECASLTAPAVDEETLLTQPDSHTVLARSHADGSERRYDVRAYNAHPAAEPEASAFPNGPPIAPTRLPGVLCLRGASRCFVPWHRESIVDLARGVAHPRGLDAAAGPLRRLLIERSAQLNESLRALGVEASLQAFERHPKEPRVSLAQWLPPLPRSLAGHVAQALAHDLYNRYELVTHGHRYSSFSQEGGHLTGGGRATRDEVREVLAWMRAHDVLPTDVASFVVRGYDEGMGIPHEPRATAFPFDEAGERAFLRATLATLAANGWPAGPVPRAWSDEPITTDLVRASIAGRAAFTRYRSRAATLMLARMLAHHLGAAAMPALIELLAAATERLAVYDEIRQVGETMAWLAHHHPALRDEALAAVEACRAKGSHTQNVAYDLELTRERVARGARHFWSNV